MECAQDAMAQAQYPNRDKEHTHTIVKHFANFTAIVTAYTNITYNLLTISDI